MIFLFFWRERFFFFGLGVGEEGFEFLILWFVVMCFNFLSYKFYFVFIGFVFRSILKKGIFFFLVIFFFLDNRLEFVLKMFFN